MTYGIAYVNAITTMINTQLLVIMPHGNVAGSSMAGMQSPSLVGIDVLPCPTYTFWISHSYVM